VIWDYAGLGRALLPEAALIAGALAVLGLDLTVWRRNRGETRAQAASGTGAVAVIAAFALALWVGRAGPVLGGAFLLDGLAVAERLGVLGLTLLVIGIGTGATPARQPPETVAIMLLAAVGFTLMGAAQNLLVAFLALELASLSLYVLVGLEPSRPDAAEAAVKYFLFGGMAAAFLLFGFSLLYGATGAIGFPQLAAALARGGMNPLLVVGLVMVVVAFGFKTAAAPFHLWAPDVYQAAPAPAAALVASASKLAAVVLFTRLLWPGLGPVAGSLVTARGGGAGWLPLVAVLAGASLLLGNLAALAQTNLRRLLAYSAIAHAGVLLLGLMAVGSAGVAPVYYYALTYGIATAGAFGVVAVIERSGVGPGITDLAGLSRRSPLLAGCLLVFILSLAGVPPLAGFFGKFIVFAAALKAGGVAGPAGWLTVGAILLSAVGLYYYLIVLKQAFVAAPPAGAGRIRPPLAAALTLLVAAGLVVALGMAPSGLLAWVAGSH